MARGAMTLSVATPLAVMIDVDDVSYIRAEDETGAFGILPGHARFITTLTVSVVTWRKSDQEHHIAVRGGILTIDEKGQVAIVTREAVGEDTLVRLGEEVLARMRKDEEVEVATRIAGSRLELAAMRTIQRYLETSPNRMPLNRAPLANVVPTRRGDLE